MVTVSMGLATSGLELDHYRFPCRPKRGLAMEKLLLDPFYLVVAFRMVLE
jgi:hypothetical protein